MKLTNPSGKSRKVDLIETLYYVLNGLDAIAFTIAVLQRRIKKTQAKPKRQEPASEKVASRSLGRAEHGRLTRAEVTK